MKRTTRPTEVARWEGTDSWRRGSAVAGGIGSGSGQLPARCAVIGNRRRSHAFAGVSNHPMAWDTRRSGQRLALFRPRMLRVPEKRRAASQWRAFPIRSAPGGVGGYLLPWSAVRTLCSVCSVLGVSCGLMKILPLGIARVFAVKKTGVFLGDRPE